jgi:hypothetical protein
MRQTLWRAAVPVVLGLAAWMCWRESALTARVAEARLHLATLHFDIGEQPAPARSLSDVLPGGAMPLAEQIRDHRATAAYWLARYDEVMTVGREEGDASRLGLAANAAFRAAQLQGGLGEEASRRLDGVLDAYAAVLRADPTNLDAAYNFEHVARLRDIVARASAPRPAKPGAPAPRAPRPSVQARAGDLPAGPTIHGQPGGPPEDIKAEEFQIIAPMDYGEREGQPESSPGGQLKRKG